MEQVVVAYEPVWAVGTGDFAAVDEVVKATQVIRKQIKALFGAKAAEGARILYGGSVDGDVAASYLHAEGVDGLLIGGASLKARVFAKIINTAHLIAMQAKE
jgi:triosephosphate isomerase